MAKRYRNKGEITFDIITYALVILVIAVCLIPKYLLVNSLHWLPLPCTMRCTSGMTGTMP